MRDYHDMKEISYSDIIASILIAFYIAGIGKFSFWWIVLFTILGAIRTIAREIKNKLSDI